MKIVGNALLGEALVRHGVDTMFFLMGGPTLGAAKACEERGIRMLDVRHEQAAAFMAQAYARVSSRPGVCMAASGPGTINLTTGLANALIDCMPVVALGGASPIAQYQRGSFQEIDQVAIMRPVTKWAERVHEARRIPEYVDQAIRNAVSGRPGPVYLDLPGDVLHQEVEADDVVWPPVEAWSIMRPALSPEAAERAASLIAGASRPVLIFGSGALREDAAEELRRLVDATGIPFFATPQARGAVPDDHAYSYPHARSTAFKEADLVIVVGTRLNHMVSFARPPRFSASATFIRIDIDPCEIGRGGIPGLGLVADSAMALKQIGAALKSVTDRSFSAWRERLAAIVVEKSPAQEAKLADPAVPIHPLRLCKEVGDFLDRDAILVVDGQEILNYGRQSLSSYFPRHRLNSGPFGTMGVGLPFGIGAKVAKPDAQVVVLHGDGAFGLNGMELDTCVRHKIPVLVVISLNGGWTADPDRKKVGRDLGYTRFDKIAETLGCHGAFVEQPDDIRPALERAKAAVARGQPAVVNVVTDWRARAVTARFTAYST